MNADAEDVTPGELRRWLARVDRRVDQLDSKVGALDNDIRDRLDRLDRVSFREWEKGREADHEYAEETRRIASSARNVAWAVLVLLFPFVIASAIALLRVAG